MFLATTLSSESWLGLFLDCDTCDTWLPRLLSGDLPLTLLELGSLGGLVAAAWLLPSEKVDVKGSWSLKELAAFLCTKEGPWRLRFFDPCNGDFMGFKQQRWRLGFHEISAGFLIRHWNHSLFFRYTTKLGIVHHQKWDATNRHGDLEQLKIGEMHIRYHKKWLIYHGLLEWWNRDLEVGAFWATRISRIYSSPVSFEPAGFFLREACAPKIGSFRARIQSYLWFQHVPVTNWYAIFERYSCVGSGDPGLQHLLGSRLLQLPTIPHAAVSRTRSEEQEGFVWPRHAGIADDHLPWQVLFESKLLIRKVNPPQW